MTTKFYWHLQGSVPDFTVKTYGEIGEFSIIEMKLSDLFIKKVVNIALTESVSTIVYIDY